jgi:hypothetical protein
VNPYEIDPQKNLFVHVGDPQETYHWNFWCEGNEMLVSVMGKKIETLDHWSLSE